MIDLHLHTCRSDGEHHPAALVDLAARAGLSAIAITDHDTVAGVEPAAARGRDCGLMIVPGVEISAALDDFDVHVLGYFFDSGHAGLAAFLSNQRQARIDRARQIASRLGDLGRSIDIEPLIARAASNGDDALGRPAIAAALVAAGHAADARAAFDELIGEGGPAFVARRTPSTSEVIGIIHDAGGLASLAHPALLRRDDTVERIAGEGLDALEVYHSAHDSAAVHRYRSLAARLGLAVTGGSDYHGPRASAAVMPGRPALPPACFDALLSAARARGVACLHEARR